MKVNTSPMDAPPADLRFGTFCVSAERMLIPNITKIKFPS
jgi:hypothetical protein